MIQLWLENQNKSNGAGIVTVTLARIQEFCHPNKEELIQIGDK